MVEHVLPLNSTKETHQLLGGIGKTKLYELLKQGCLQGVRIGHRHLVQRATTIEQYIKRLQQGPAMTMYGAILADPPWRFVTYSERGTRRGAASHYNVMPFDALAAIPVGDWAARDCILFLWVPKPNLLHRTPADCGVGFGL